MEYVARWFTAFLFTVAVEVPIATTFLRGKEPFPVWRRFVLALAAQCASHPAVWVVYPELPIPYWTMIVIAETWAFGSETVLYAALGRGVSWRRAAGVSLVANGLSYGIGLLLQTWGWLR